MSTLALDTSAAVKLLLPEIGATVVSDLWDGSARVVASTLIRPEIASALSRRRRQGDISAAQHRSLSDAWEVIRSEIGFVQSNGDVVDLAVDLTHRHPLSGADAVHLASALVLDIESESDGENVQLSTLHAAKGLEFTRVFLPGWEEQVLT